MHIWATTPAVGTYLARAETSAFAKYSALLALAYPQVAGIFSLCKSLRMQRCQSMVQPKPLTAFSETMPSCDCCCTCMPAVLLTCAAAGCSCTKWSPKLNWRHGHFNALNLLFPAIQILFTCSLASCLGYLCICLQLRQLGLQHRQQLAHPLLGSLQQHCLYAMHMGSAAAELFINRVRAAASLNATLHSGAETIQRSCCCCVVSVCQHTWVLTSCRSCSKSPCSPCCSAASCVLL